MPSTLPSSSKSILAIAHRIMMDGKPKLGGMDIILDYLRSEGYSVLMVEFQLAGGLGFSRAPGLDTRGFCAIRRLGPDGETQLLRVAFPRVPEMMRWIMEVARLPSILKKAGALPLPSLAMAADPLCCLAALHLQRKGWIERLHFHCVDYSDSRFGNPLLDAVYRGLYRYAVRRAASVDVVSRPMFKKVSGFLSGKTDKLLWMPNTPDFAGYPCLPPEERQRHTLVCSATGIEPLYRFEAAIEVLGRLRPSFPDARLVLMGKTDLNPEYVEMLKARARSAQVGDCVEWAGFMPRDEARRKVAQCGIGVAFYDRSVPHVRYIDSLKIREYAASGLPVLGDSACATSGEAQESGAGVVAESAEDAAGWIRTLWEDESRYVAMATAARRWAEATDKRFFMPQLHRLIGLC